MWYWPLIPSGSITGKWFNFNPQFIRLNIHEILKEYWGFDRFRPLQEDIINAVLEGKDTLALLPTGGGKSVCFQVPALAKDGLCLVISPLIALMKDQVESLKRKGVLSLAIYSGMSFIEIKKTLQNAAYGNYKLLYVSPERLETSLFLEYLPALNINLIAVDEAHCISQWGYDFRPPYTRIAKLREYLPGVPVLALTASATKPVQDDICDKLQFAASHQRFQPSFERPNLSYSVFNIPSKQNKLLEILNNVKGSAIVYCKSRKHTTEIARLLKMNNINAGFYHAGLSNEERNARQLSWINSHTRVMVCTNAFGMGIDKAAVRVVVHYDVPDSLENYYQEAGRAGRDGKRAYAVLLYNHKELEGLAEQADTRFPAEEQIRQVYIALMNHLQVPAGSGEGQSYDFDIAVFASAFKLNILLVSYAIKALEQEGILSYNELVFNPPTVVFTASKEQLSGFENGHPELEPLIKGLLRSYEGIFDFPSIVYESRLADFLRQDAATIKKDLGRLNDFGIISYVPQKEKPQISLLQNRMYADTYLMNNANYLKRKESFKQRVNVMTDYIKNQKECRSKMVASYFNDHTTTPCGICDNCIHEKMTGITREEFNTISEAIMNEAKKASFTADKMFGVLKVFNRQKVWQVVNYLQSERKIEVNKEGYISVFT